MVKINCFIKNIEDRYYFITTYCILLYQTNLLVNYFFFNTILPPTCTHTYVCEVRIMPKNYNSIPSSSRKMRLRIEAILTSKTITRMIITIVYYQYLFNLVIIIDWSNINK